MAVIAIWTMDVAMIMVVSVVVIAVRAVNVIVLGHANYSGIKSPGIISPLRDMCTLRPNIQPVFTAPCSR